MSDATPAPGETLQTERAVLGLRGLTVRARRARGGP